MFTDAEKINTKGYFENQNGCLKENYKFRNILWMHSREIKFIEYFIGFR